MSRPELGVRFTIGEFEFDPATGELRREGVEPQRLGPQPTALLGLLIASQGSIVGRDEIRARLWPDVNVDFDASLHHCVRQVRAAFGERASDAAFIETIPKRGYRLKTPAIRVEPRAEPESSVPPPELVPEPTSVPPSRSRRGTLTLFAGLGLVAITALGLAWVGTQSEPIRLAILPFEDPTMTEATAAEAGRLGERVLAELTVRLDDHADVIGPRSTGPLRERGLSLAEIAEQLDADYLINARFTGTRDEPALLVELIRSSDGKHVWVEYYDQPARWESSAPQIIDGIAQFLLAS